MTKGKPRNLRLAVVDDSPKDLEAVFGNVDPVFFPDYGAATESMCITSWAQSVEVHAMRKRKRVDLLCMDVKFHYDTTDLPFYNELQNGQVDESRPNPMGLLLGLVLVARYVSRTRPFACVVYSGDASAVAKDAMAVACMGMLEAILGRRFSRETKKGDLRDFVSSILSRFPVSTPTGKRHELLSNYRDDFIRNVGEFGRVDVEDNVEPLLDLCRKGSGSLLKDQGLKLFVNDRVDNIRIGSLFADFPDLGREEIGQFIVPFLEKLLEIDASTRDDLYPCVVNAMALFDEQYRQPNLSAGHETLISIIDSVGGYRSNRPDRPDLALACVVCMFLEIRKEGFSELKGLRDRVLERLCAIQTSLDRELKLIDASMTLGSLLKRLRSETIVLDERFRMCGLMYATGILGLQGNDVPLFLRRFR